MSKCSHTRLLPKLASETVALPVLRPNVFRVQCPHCSPLELWATALEVQTTNTDRALKTTEHQETEQENMDIQ
jgi:hypothetical protein